MAKHGRSQKDRGRRHMDCVVASAAHGRSSETRVEKRSAAITPVLNRVRKAWPNRTTHRNRLDRDRPMELTRCAMSGMPSLVRGA